MTTKMKGLLKGLRYISQIFDSEKEQEMQIGYPTDVKHLAHIGWDGPSANSPSWLKEFKITPGSPGVLNSVGEVNSPTKSSTKDSLLRDITKMHKSSGAPLDSPTQCSTSKTKQSRRHHSSNGSVALKAQDSSGFSKSRQTKNSLPDLLNRDSSYSPRQHQKSNIGLESPDPDPPASPKPSHQTKSEGSSDGGLSTDYQDLKVRIH